MRKISQRELSDPEFVRDLRAHCEELSQRLGLSPWCWRDWLSDLNRDLDLAVENEAGEVSFIDLECFEGSDEFEEEPDTIAYWFRSFCTRVPEGVRPRIRDEARPRIIALGTLLSAHDPEAAASWGTQAH